MNLGQNPWVSTHVLKRGTNGARALLRALASIKKSRQELERLIDQTDNSDEYTLGLLGPILSELRSAQSTIEQLSQSQHTA